MYTVKRLCVYCFLAFRLIAQYIFIDLFHVHSNFYTDRLTNGPACSGKYRTTTFARKMPESRASSLDAGRAKQKPLMTCIRSLGEEPCSPHFPDYLVQVPATSDAALCQLPARGGNRREVPVQREGEDIIFHNIWRSACRPCLDSGTLH